MLDAAQFWDKMAESYARSPIGDMDAYEYTLGRTRSYLSADDHVLELGCGTGSTALLLAPHVAQIDATDISQNMITIAQGKAKEAGIINADFKAADAISASDQRYDAVLAFNLLHLIEDVDATLASIAAQTKPGGLFISKTVCKPNGGLSFKHRLMFLALPLMQMIGKAPFVRFSEIADWDARVEAAGFKIIETGNHPIAPPSRYIVARKL